MDGPVGIYNQPSAWTLETAYAYATSHAVPSPDPGGEPLYNCPFSPCSKQFSKRFNLKAHLRVHTGDKPFACSFPGCTRRFMWKSSLTSHQTGHSRRKAELAKRSASTRDRCTSQSHPQPSTDSVSRSLLPPRAAIDNQSMDRVITPSSWAFNHRSASSNLTSTYPPFSQQQQQHDIVTQSSVLQVRRLNLSHQSPNQQSIPSQPNAMRRESQHFLSTSQHHPSSQAQVQLRQSTLNQQSTATTSAPAMSFISTDDALPVPLVHSHSHHLHQDHPSSSALPFHPSSASQSFPSHMSNSSQPLTHPASRLHTAVPPMSDALPMSRTDSAISAAPHPNMFRSTLQYSSTLPPRPHDTVPASSSCLSNHGNFPLQSRLHPPVQTDFHQASHSSPSNPHLPSQPDFHRLSATSAPLYNEVYSESCPDAPRKPSSVEHRYRTEADATEGNQNKPKPHWLQPHASPPVSSSTNPFSHPTSNSEVRSSIPSTQPSPSSSSSPCGPPVSQPNTASLRQPLGPTPDKQLLTSGIVAKENNTERKISPSKMEDIKRNVDIERDIKDEPQAVETVSEAVVPAASAASSSSVTTPTVLKKPLKSSGLGSSHATCGSLSTSSLLPSPSASLGMPVSPSAFSQQFLCRDALSPTWPTTSNSAQIGGPFSNVAAMSVSPKPESGRVTPMEVQMASLDGHSGDRNGSVSGTGIGVCGGESSPLPVDLPISPGVTSPVPPPMLPQVQNGSRPRRMVNRGMKPPLVAPNSLSSAAAGGLLPPLSGAAPKNPPTHIDLGGLVDDEPNSSSLPALGGPSTDFSPLPFASPIFGAIVTPTSPFSALAHSATVKPKSTTTPTSTW